MEKFSVRKPYTVLVGVIMVLVLGIVSAMNMTTDLLPSLSLPYLIVITPYPGASPERVESQVSEPMEQALGTVSNVKNVLSSSAENYSMVQLEFEDGTNMDSAMVKVSSTVEQVRATLPETCGTPQIMEISFDMVATMYVAIGREGYDIYQLSDYISNDLKRRIERAEGVASVTGVGLVEKTIAVELDPYKIDRLNDRVLSMTADGLDEAGRQLDEAKQQVETGKAELEKQEKSFGAQIAEGITTQLNAASEELSYQARVKLVELIQQIEELEEKVREAGKKRDAMEEKIEGYELVFSTAAWELEGAAKMAGDDVSLILDAFNRSKLNFSSAVDAMVAAYNSYLRAKNGTEWELLEASRVWKEKEVAAKNAIDDMAEAEKNLESSVNDFILTLQEADFEDTEWQQSFIASLQSVSENLVKEGEQRKTDFESLLAIAAAETSELDPEEIRTRFANAETVSAWILSLLESNNLTKHYVGAARNVEGGVKGVTNNLTGAAGELTTILEILRNALNGLNGGSVHVAMIALNRIASVLPDIQRDIEGMISEVSSQIPETDDVNQTLLDAKYQVAVIYEKIGELPQYMGQAGDAIAMLSQGQLDASVGFSQAANQLADAEAQLTQAQTQYDSIRESAMESANLDQLLSVQTLSQLIYAQNFSMPAGYISDAEGTSWLLKVGDEYETTEDIEAALLADVEGIGTVRLADVATITVIDNAGESYTRLNGQPSVVVAVFKGSTAGTNQVSRNVNEAFEEIKADTPGISIVGLMDQGSYITMIVRDLLTSMALGALLAIVVLALFLRDIRPTIMVGISIPLSVLFTLVLMYFTGLTLNIMTLSGLSLGIGMLVDNSVVVMENIMRLRQRGIESARSAVQGAKQVSTSIIASTLTTICVFLPMVFTNGTVRELLLPMALSITYCLTASLVVAMTVVPSSASIILRRIRKPKPGFFSRMLDGYGELLSFFLAHKFLPLAFTVGLLALCIFRLVTMGIVLIPEMSADNIQVSVDTHEYTDADLSYARADEAMGRIMEVEGVKDVGFMDASSTAGLVSQIASAAASIGNYVGYVTVDSGLGKSEVDGIVAAIAEACTGLDSTVEVSTSMMGELSSFLSSGLTVNVYGYETDEVAKIANDVSHLIVETGGFEHIHAGTDETQSALHLVIDKDKAMGYGLTVAQIYMRIAEELTTEMTSTTIRVDGVDLSVVISDASGTLTRENILNLEFEPASQGDMAAEMGMGADSLMQMFGEAQGAEEGGEEGEEGEEAKEEEPKTHKLSEFAWLEETAAPAAINRENMSRYSTVSADVKPGYNTAIQSRILQEKLDTYNETLPSGYTAEIGGETTQIQEMIRQMSLLLLLALIFIYLVMVAQFQSLLSPFIILFTVPLAFTGGMLGLIMSGEQLSMISLMGFLVLMGTVVNNGIVFVDYTNQLRIGGMERADALVATGKTRMRPILMTTLTTVLAMTQMIFGDGIGAQMGRGMAIVIVGGLTYSTLMTLFVIPIMYDLLYRKKPLNVEVDDSVDDIPDDAAEFIEELNRTRRRERRRTGKPYPPDDDNLDEDECMD